MAKKLRKVGKTFTNAVDGSGMRFSLVKKGDELGRNSTITDAMFQKELKRMAEEKEKQRKAAEA